MKIQRTLLVAAAFAGVLCARPLLAADSNSDTGTNAPGKSAPKDNTGKNSCAGKNSCKGAGGCKSGDNGCKGQNSCKGKGGCNTKDGCKANK